MKELEIVIVPEAVTALKLASCCVYAVDSAFVYAFDQPAPGLKIDSPATPSCAVKTIAKSVPLCAGVAETEIVLEDVERIASASTYKAADGTGPPRKVCGDCGARVNASKPVGLSVWRVGVKILGMLKLTNGADDVEEVVLLITMACEAACAPTMGLDVADRGGMRTCGTAPL